MCLCLGAINFRNLERILTNRMFPTSFNKIVELMDNFSPASYSKTRNFLNGAVSRLSPYISRGVLSTKIVFKHLLSKNYKPYAIEKFIQELAWRDYWQNIWIVKKNEINNDLKSIQSNVSSSKVPSGIVDAKTGISAIDDAIVDFYKTGYLHNHMRMYIAALACNVGKCHWRVPAQWMYYHLLDGDWASNALSWQWVAGTNSNKKYFANQENINKFFYSKQKHTYLDVNYTSLYSMDVPKELSTHCSPNLKTSLPKMTNITIEPSKPTLIYNYYNLDPVWRANQDANRILLLEPSVFKQYPVSKTCIEFAIKLSENIPGIKIFTGEFEDLTKINGITDIYFKEHPLNIYRGNEDQRDWMSHTKGYFPSFFKFWNKCRKELL